MLDNICKAIAGKFPDVRVQILGPENSAPVKTLVDGRVSEILQTRVSNFGRTAEEAESKLLDSVLYKIRCLEIEAEYGSTAPYKISVILREGSAYVGIDGNHNVDVWCMLLLELSIKHG